MRTLLFSGFLMLMGICPAMAEVNPDDFKLRVVNASVAPTAAGGSVAISALLANPTSSTLVLVGASSPLAGQTILQRYTKDAQGLVQLQPLNQLVLAPGSDTVLAPGELEFQLVGLTTELQAGLELPLTLKFADGTERVVRIGIRE